MREILFRGKTKSGKWVEGNGIQQGIGHIAYERWVDICDDKVRYEVIPETVGQYTGLVDKIENGTLVFKKEIPNKYYALVLHRDCYGKNSWHIHHAPVEYEKENNRVAIQVNGILYVTTKNMLFLTKPEAEAKLRELKGEQQ